MTIPRTIRYLCGHQEAVRLSGVCVGVLAATYTIAVPFECGGPECRVRGRDARNDETPRPGAAGEERSTHEHHHSG